MKLDMKAHTGTTGLDHLGQTGYKRRGGPREKPAAREAELLHVTALQAARPPAHTQLLPWAPRIHRPFLELLSLTPVPGPPGPQVP